MQFGEKVGEPLLKCKDCVPVWEYETSSEESGHTLFEEKERDNIHTWLLHLAHSYGAMNYRYLSAMGIHPGQLPVMRVVSIKEGITQRELARELRVKPPTIAVTIKRMEKAGLICRREDQTDRRVCRLYLTDAGRTLDGTLKGWIEENGKILLKGFSEEEVQEMKGYFDRIIRNMQDISESKE